VIDGESKGGDCDEVICAEWGKPGGEWTEWGWRNEEGSLSQKPICVEVGPPMTTRFGEVRSGTAKGQELMI